MPVVCFSPVCSIRRWPNLLALATNFIFPVASSRLSAVLRRNSEEKPVFILQERRPDGLLSRRPKATALDSVILKILDESIQLGAAQSSFAGREHRANFPNRVGVTCRHVSAIRAPDGVGVHVHIRDRSEEHTSELQSRGQLV